jgi:2-polyprenyl-3-methyl-5-hydroxy-6-metoxy-1,4-benzoquinol methylase
VSEEPENERCCFDDWVDRWEKQAKKKDTVAGVTASLLAALDDLGVARRTVLDVGCGIGDLAIETVMRGAARATGFDLSEKAIEQARELAKVRGGWPNGRRSTWATARGWSCPAPTSSR